MADPNPVIEFLKGDYGFLTVLVAIIFIAWLIVKLRTRAKIRKLEKAKVAGKNPGQVLQLGDNYQQSIIPPQAHVPTMDDPFFDLANNERGLEGLENDAMRILATRTQTIDTELRSERASVESKLAELNKTEREIRSIVEQLKINYKNVKRQQKTYEFIKRSLSLTEVQ